MSFLVSFCFSFPRYEREFLNLLHGLKITEADLDWDRVRKGLENYRAHTPANRNFKDFKTGFNKLAVLLGLGHVTGADRIKYVKHKNQAMYCVT